MTAAWRTVRVFISSTFRDMHAERDHLVKVVFPALRERLHKYRIYLDDIDLRWGVRREDGINQRTLDLCFRSIHESRPYFVGLLGDVYGTKATQLPESAKKAYPWLEAEEGKSYTELEILYRLFQLPDLEERAFFCFRDLSLYDGIPEPKRSAVFIDPANRGLQDTLKQRIRDHLRNRGIADHLFDNYPAHWNPHAPDWSTNSSGRVDGLSSFGEWIIERLWQGIKVDYHLLDGPAEAPTDEASKQAEEQEYHERFIETRLRVFVGREQINDTLLAFVGGDDQFPCLVTGPSGSGKSAALARFVRYSQYKQPQLLVIPHFIGASPRSTNLRDMLRRFCQHFKARFGFPEDVPEEVAELSVTFRESVGKVPAESRVLLVIDALDHLNEADRAAELFWLPTELPPQVKVIVSCLSDSGNREPVLEALTGRRHLKVHLTPLSDAEQREIIRQVPLLSAKTLDDDQVRLLLSNPATSNPLFLLVALEELRGFASYKRLNDRIAAFPREGDTVTAIFTQVIERLAEDFNPTLVETVLTLLASARRGLSERELQDLVAGLDGAEDLFPVLRQLRPYLLSRGSLIDFYHRNLPMAVRQRYLPSAEQQRQAHGRLAEYFGAQQYWLEPIEEQQQWTRNLPPAPRPANVRKVDELPWQRLQAADWHGSEQLLTDLAFLESKAEAGMVFDLAADFSAAIARMPAGRVQLRILRLLAESLRRDIHFIARHPTTLFQCLWNSCWWYDCPEAARYYDQPQRAKKLRLLPWLRPGPKLYLLLEKWRDAKSVRGPWGRRLRRLRRARLPTVSSLVLIVIGCLVPLLAFAVQGIPGAAFASCVAAAMSFAHSLSLARAYRGVLSVVTGGAVFLTLQWTERLYPGLVPVLRFVICTCVIWDDLLVGMIRFYLHNLMFHARIAGFRQRERRGAFRWLRSLRPPAIPLSETHLTNLTGHEGDVTWVAIASDGHVIASTSSDNTLRIWNVDTGEERFCVHDSEVGRNPVLKFSPDGRRLLVVSATTVVEYAIDSATILRRFDLEQSSPAIVQSIPSGWAMLPRNSQTVIWVDENLGMARRLLLRLGGTTFGSDDPSGPPLLGLSISPDGRKLATQHLAIGGNPTFRLWDAASGQMLAHTVLEVGDTATPCKATVSSLGTVAIAHAIGSSRKLLVWEATRDPESVRTFTHPEGEALFLTDRVEDLALSSDDRHLVAGFNDGSVVVWEIENGEAISVDRGHTRKVLYVGFTQNGAGVVSAGEDRTIRMSKITADAADLQLKGNTAPIIRCETLAETPAGESMLCVMDRKGLVAFHNILNGECTSLTQHQLNKWDYARAFVQSGIVLGSMARYWKGGVSDSAVQRSSGEIVGYVPGVYGTFGFNEEDDLGALQCHPSGYYWFGYQQNYLSLFQLEVD